MGVRHSTSSCYGFASAAIILEERMTISTPLVTLQVLATLHNTIALNTATNNKAASTYVNCDCQCSSLTFQVCLFVSFVRSSLRYRGIEIHPTGQIWPNPGKLQIVSTRVGKWLKNVIKHEHRE